MSFRSHKNFQEIIMYLSVLRYVFKSNSKQQFTDFNKVAENFFKKILNITLDKNFQNLNEISKNYPAIDLGDTEARICFQVTAENSASKIKDTISKFIAKDLQDDYDVLNVLIITSKKNYTTSFTKSDDPIAFDPKENIWDIDDLLEYIEKLNSDKLEELHNFIEYELTALVDVFSQKNSLLRNAEHPTDLPPKNGKAFFKKFEFEPFEIKDALADLNKLYIILNNDIPKKTREYLYTFMLKGKSVTYAYSQHITIKATKIEGFLNIGRTENREHFNILIEAKIGDYDEDASDNLFVRYYMINEVDLLSLLKEQFSDPEDLKDLIVNCNFTKLDE
jgi:hypothetical protein